MKTKIYNLIILDASGSMTSIKEKAVSGLNETIQTIRESQNKHEDLEHYVSLVSFNSLEIKTIYQRELVSKIKELPLDKYNPSCGTPLYDAMGFSITQLNNKIGTNGKVLVTIITDGYENASKEYNSSSIMNLIDQFKGKGWVFTYIGANHDVEEVASSIHINNSISFESTSKGTTQMFAREKRARTRFYDRIEESHGDVDCCMNADYFSEE